MLLMLCVLYLSLEIVSSQLGARGVCKLNCVTHPASPAPAGAGLAG